MFTYRSSGWWNNSVWFHLLLCALIWLPIAFFGIYMAIEAKDVSGYFIFPSLIIVWALFLFKRAQSKIHFPAIELTEQHLILNSPMYNRRVYNLESIEGPRFLLGILYFRHLGWPVISSFATMSKEKQVAIMNILKSS